MPHQCLKCGKVYADGSQEVLKGCAGCEGTRFFYTKDKLNDIEREKLQTKADEDLKNIVQQIMNAKEKPNYRDTVWTEQSRKAWVRLTPGDIRAAIDGISSEIKAEKTGAAEDVSGIAGASAEPQHIGVISKIVQSQGIGEDEKGAVSAMEAKVSGISPAERLEGEIRGEKRILAPEQAKVIRAETKAPREITSAEMAVPVASVAKPVMQESAAKSMSAASVAPAKVPARRAPSSGLLEKPKSKGEEKETKPETVEIIESGVYSIDVKDLMEHAPIIVQKDGSYLIHLPSAFESVKPVTKKKARLKNS